MRLEQFADAGQRPSDSAPLSTATRRGFLQASAVLGGGLLLSFGLPPALGRAAAAAEPGTFAPNAFIRIGRDGQVTLIMPQVEMGQGTYTSMAMLIAEELEVDLSDVRVEHAPPDDQLYGNPLIGLQFTGGSTSVRAFFAPLRQAGATARSMLVSAAAKTWQVDASTCRAEKGAVIHDATARALDYRELVGKAAMLPVPESVALKDSKDWRLIGTPAKRLDTADKVNGRAVFGIDVQIPGMKFATLAQSPVFGGRVRSVDDSEALAVKGVRQVVRLDDAVAVVADHMGAAKKGLAALEIGWDEGPNATLGTADVVRALESASQGAAPSRAARATSRRPWRAPRPRSRRPTRCRFSLMPRWSR
jgi:isoquinoline 1-oxidoreductase subunit beta